MRVLIVKTSSMGDVLHTLPSLTDAMQIAPEIKFDWVVEESFSQIPGWHPAVENVIPVAIRRWRKNWFNEITRQERSLFLSQIRQYSYDAIIDAQGLLKSAILVTRNANGPKHGYNWNSAREPMASWFYNIRHHVSKEQHAVERIRQLFALSLNYPLSNNKGDYAIANHFLTTLPEDANQYLVFLHATTRDEKHWPEDHWRKLITQLESIGLKIKLPWGTTNEHERAIRLAQGFKHVEVLPKLPLSDIAKILAGAKAVISVDTGLSHLTAALDRPNITLYGPTDPGLIGGYGKNQYSMISENKDMSALSPQLISDKLKTLI